MSSLTGQGSCTREAVLGGYLGMGRTEIVQPGASWRVFRGGTMDPKEEKAMSTEKPDKPLTARELIEKGVREEQFDDEASKQRRAAREYERQQKAEAKAAEKPRPTKTETEEERRRDEEYRAAAERTADFYAKFPGLFPKE